MGYLLHPQQDLKRVSVKDAQFIGVITSMAALRKTDVYAFAQCSQLFPSPSEYRCADSQILTHAKAFEEYFHPSPFLKRKKKIYFKCAPLKSTYFNQTCIEFSTGFNTYSKSCNYYIYPYPCFC